MLLNVTDKFLYKIKDVFFSNYFSLASFGGVHFQHLICCWNRRARGEGRVVGEHRGHIDDKSRVLLGVSLHHLTKMNGMEWYGVLEYNWWWIFMNIWSSPQRAE